MALLHPRRIFNETAPRQHFTTINQKLEAHVTAQDLKKSLSGALFKTQKEVSHFEILFKRYLIFALLLRSYFIEIVFKLMYHIFQIFQCASISTHESPGLWGPFIAACISNVYYFWITPCKYMLKLQTNKNNQYGVYIFVWSLECWKKPEHPQFKSKAQELGGKCETHLCTMLQKLTDRQIHIRREISFDNFSNLVCSKWNV